MVCLEKKKEKKGREKLPAPDAKSTKSTHSNVVRYEVFYAKQFSRRVWGKKASSN